MSAHNIYIPPELWSRIQAAAAQEGARQGQTVSVSEWMREAAEARLSRAPAATPADTTTNEGEG